MKATVLRMANSKEAVVKFSGTPGKGLTFEEFDQKALSWARKQYGNAYAKPLWENTLPNINDLGAPATKNVPLFLKIRKLYFGRVLKNTLHCCHLRCNGPLGGVDKRYRRCLS